MSTQPQEQAERPVVGVDVGASKTVVSLAAGTLVLNEMGSRTTPSMVGFRGRERLVGERAASEAVPNAANTALELGALVGLSFAQLRERLEAFDSHRLTYVAGEDGRLCVSVQYGEGQQQLFLEQVLGAFLRTLDAFVERDCGARGRFVVALPDEATPQQCRAVVDAAAIGGVELLRLVAVSDALAECHVQQHPREAESAPETVLMVDVGHSSTNVSAVELAHGAATVLAFKTDADLGGKHVDRRVARHIIRVASEKHGLPEVQLRSKPGHRVLQAAERLKVLLSTVGDSNVTVENIGDDRDLSFNLSRAELEEMCAPEREQLRSLVHCLMSALGGREVTAVELVGGGSRVPFVRAVLEEVAPLRQMLDSSAAVAQGAAMLGERLSASAQAPHEVSQTSQTSQEEDEEEEEVAPPTAPAAEEEAKEEAAEEEAKEKDEKAEPRPLEVAPSPFSEEALAAAVLEEERMRAQDAEIARIADARNQLESLVFDMRGAASGPHGEHLDSAALTPLLDAAEDWLYTDEADAADLAAMTAKVDELQAALRAQFGAYFAAKEAAQAEVERQLEEEAARAAAERAANPDEDEDLRKLPFSARMRMIMKNKDEGTELFRDGNHEMAARRYVKSLSHCGKLFDMSPSEQSESDAVRLSLYLNLAQCYLKLDLPQRVAGNVERALEIDPDNVKALYRRAVAYERLGDFDNANADNRRAAELAPEDRAVGKLQARIDAQLARQAAKEKKMWKKAFQ